MLKPIDNFLNQITMYKLVLYYLNFIWLAAFILTFFGSLPFGPVALLGSTIFILAICWLTNFGFAKLFKVPANVESVYITAFILALLIQPSSAWLDPVFLSMAITSSIIAMATKYILAIKKKHLFNPVAIGLVLATVILGQYATWWVGTTVLTPFVLVGGLLLTRKLIRTDLVLSFLLAWALVSIFLYQNNLWTLLVASPILFFTFIMLTEPFTTPATRAWRIAYGIIVAILFSVPFHIGNWYLTPELALVIGNIFSYIVSPKQKLILTLKKRIQSAPDIIDFIFNSDQKLQFKAGQYMEFTIDGRGADSRGNRRYLTVASSPTEDVIAIGVRFPEKPSTFKQRLLEMKPGDKIVAGQLAGDFTLPKDNNKKLVLVAGGIGITPYYSMVKSMIDRDEKRDVVLLYSNKVSSDAIYQFLWAEAKEKIGLKTIYAVTDKNDPKYTGRITSEMIKKEIPDYFDRYFYLSGPRALVTGFEKTLKSLGVKHSHIKTDFFPGYV